MDILSENHNKKRKRRESLSIGKEFRFLDLFAGAGGLSEGFIRAGFIPVAHVEMDTAACFTLKTRAVFHWLKAYDNADVYDKYLSGEISRRELYSKVPQSILDSVIEEAISPDTRDEIYEKIDNLLGNNSLDVIIGGPPCQAYSLVGRSRDANNMRGDKRNYLYLEYIEFLKKYKPKFFVFENVLGLLSAIDVDGQKHFDKVLSSFNDCGYSVEYKILNAKDYGVLQNRKRIVLVGKRGRGQSGFYPKMEEEENNYTVGEIFNDLPSIKSGEGQYTSSPVKRSSSESYLVHSKIKDPESTKVTFHIARYNNERDLKIYKKAVKLWNSGSIRIKYNELEPDLQTHNNKDVFTDKFKVVCSDLPYSQTVVAHLSKDGHYYIHPDIRQNRSITPREAARLQSFPDDYYFESKTGKPSKTVAFRQIGNAVPVLLAERIADGLIKELL